MKTAISNIVIFVIIGFIYTLGFFQATVLWGLPGFIITTIASIITLILLHFEFSK